jgi:protein-serine/threonine kinase
MGQPPAQDSLTRRPPTQPADEPLSPGSHHPAPIPAPDPPISHPTSLINLPDPLLQNACQDTPSEEPQGQFQYFSPVTSKLTWPPVTVLPGASVPVFHVRQPSTHVNALPTQPLPVPELPSSGTVLGDQQNKAFILEDTVHQIGLQPSAEEKISGLTAASAPIPVHAPPLRSQLSTMSFTSQHSLSPASAISSPSLAAMADLTPLPSPLLPEDSPGPWRQNHARPGSAGSLRSLSENVQVEDFKAAPSTTPATSRALSTKRKKTYSSLMPAAVEGSSSARKYEPGHARNRSLSEFVPEAVHNVRPRNSTLSGLPRPDETPIEQPLQREEYLAEQRGLVQPHNNPRSQTHADTPASLPTPPPSNRSVTESEGDELMREEEHYTPNLTVRDQKTGQKVYYRPIRPLGQGTFSKVVLATSQALPGNFPLNEHSESSLDPKQLVAIKIVGHGPAGGADEERVELSLKREIEIMKTISHPSLIHLKAYDFNDDETLLVLGYCAGGDLFDLASQSRDALTPRMVQRIFAELVDAVKYLHSLWIVHRDIKLESVYSYNLLQ